MKRIILIGIAILLMAAALPVATGWLNYSGAKNYAMWTTKWLQADQVFYWQGDTIKKDSLVYTDLKTDSARFRYINGTFSPWFYAGKGQGSMTWPATPGIPYYNGTGWGTSITDNSATWNKAVTADATFSAANYLLKTADTGRKAVASGIYEDASGKVGLSTNSPIYKFDVRGTSSTDFISSNIGFNINRVPNPTTGQISAAISSGGSVDTGLHGYYVTYVTAIGETSAAGPLSVTTTPGNNTVILTIPVSPDSRVTGRKIYRTKAGSIYSDYFLALINDNTTTSYIDVYSDSSLTGTFPMSYYRSNTTSNQILVNGVRSMLVDDYATYFGVAAGSSITTGGYNTFIGSYAGQYSTSGLSNVFVGYLTGRNNTTGSSNVAIGTTSMYANVSGSNTISLGTNSGRYYQESGSNQLTSTSNSIFIGYNSRSGSTTNTTTNEIVLGHNLTGKGSNTATWGNTSITDHYFTGKIRANTALISTNAAAGKMLYSSDVNGNLTYTNTPSDGQVMKFTGGVPTWSAESSGGTTNLAYTASATNGIVTSDTGTDATIPAGSTTNASLMLPGDKTKLDGITNYAPWTISTDNVFRAFINSGGNLNLKAGTNMSISANGSDITFNSTGGGSGTVTSVGLSAPTGFQVTGSPVTTSGTLGLSFATGYSLPSDATQATWTTAYNNRIANFTTTGNSGAATFSGNTLNIPNYTLAGLGGQPKPSTTYLQFGTSNGWSAFDGTLDRYASYVLQRIATDGGGAFVGSTFPAASTTEAGMMSAADKTNLDAAVSNSGKVKLFGTSTWGELSANYFEWNTNSFRPIRDGSPQENSLYPITSGGVYTALLAKANLSGATFTGAISGTSASFSSTVTASDFQLSDRRLKTDIRELKNIGWADKIDFVSYRMKADSSQRLRYGVIAQDIEKFAPELVNTDVNGTKSVSYIDLLIVKNQQLQNQINFQRYEILFSICLSCFLFIVVVWRGAKRS